MPRPTPSWLWRYGLAILVTLLALSLRLVLEPVLGSHGSHQVWGLFYLAVVIATLYGGLGPGLWAVALGLAAGWYFFIEPRYGAETIDRGMVVGLAVFVVLAIVIALLVAGLQEARRRTEALTQVIDRGPIFARDYAGRVTWWSSGAESFYGFTPGEAVGQPSRALLKTEFPVPLEEIEHQVRTRGDWQGLLRHTRKDGTRLWVTSQWMLQRDGDGGPESILEIQTDTTARVAAEDALRRSERAIRESEARFRLMADSAPVLIWVNGPTGECQFVNRQYVEFVGLPAAGIMPNGWRAALHPDDAQAYLSAYEEASRTLTPFRAQTRMHRHDDVYRWMECVGVPRLDEMGNFLGYVGCSYDVTEQREAEEGLREAGRRKDEFLAMLAHELRNPLAPIRNAAGIVRTLAPPEPRLTRAREMIDRQVDHLTRLVDDLLDVSRITRGKIALQRQPLVVSDVVHEAVDAARPFIEQQHQLFMHLARERLVVEGDRARLVQVVSNLLSNATKFTPPGGEIHVTTAATPEGAQIRVRDTGVGVPPESQARVFDLFSQEHTTLDRSRGGLGIGLTLVKQLVEQHGGTVTLSSAGAGQGSEFAVTLPPLVASEPATASGNGTTEAPPSGVRVLLVEDNRDAAESFSLLLRLAGHEVQVAYDGLQALRVFDEFAPQVAFVDLGLPGIDGFEVARRLRQAARGDGAVLIALSGYGRDEDKAKAREAGFDQHLTKPVDERVVNEILTRADTRESA